MTTPQTDQETQARARIEADPRLVPHAPTLLHPTLQNDKHHAFLTTHHTDQLVGLAKTLEELGLLK